MATTKIKILGGFTLMILLMATIATVSYRGLRQSSDSFASYQRLAASDVSLGETLVSLQTAATNVQMFINAKDDKYMKEVQTAVAAAEKHLAKTKSYTDNSDSQGKLSEIEAQVQKVKAALGPLEKNIIDFSNSYDTIVRPNYKKALDGFSSLTDQALSVGNAVALNDIGHLLNSFVLASGSMGHFASSRSGIMLEDAKKNMSRTADMFQKLGTDLHTDGGKAIYAEQQKAFAALADVAGAMQQQAAEAQQSMDEINGRMAQALASISALNSNIATELGQVSESILASNADTSRNALLVTAGGLIIGLAVASILVFGIMRVLRELADFAESVASGDFTRTIKSREKGEVGTVIKAVQDIPRMFRSIIEFADRVSGDILVGRMRNRLDTTQFPGEFAELGKAINTVSDAFTGVIDSLPVPVMACDKHFDIQFLNTIAQNVMGGSTISGQCKAQLNAGPCGTDMCLGKRAMEKNGVVSDEVTIYPQGKKMEIAVTALPVHNMQGEVSGFFEIITDLTDVKNKQATLQDVTTKASAIAHRLAAASEELSSQVEHISQGAELQRSRVESTASAMTQMNATVLEVARNASQASEQSEKTKEKADGGAQLVNQVIQSINHVNSVAVTLQNNMQELGSQAEGIGGLMNVISDIADQTNLLALNAAIEAARAGEAGRGFAVVADEVRKLAESTMSATHEVGSSIKAIQNSTRVNIDEVSTAVKSISEATELANSSGNALGEIVELASASSQVVTSIATAAEQQSATSEEINRAIDEINSVVSETSKGIIQSSAAVQDLSRMAQELDETIGNLPE